MADARVARSLIAVIIALMLAGAASTMSAYADESAAQADGGTLVAGGVVQGGQGDAASVPEKKHPKAMYKVSNGKAWQKSWTAQAKAAGRAGKGISQVKLKIENDGVSGSANYRVFVPEKKGWQKWKSNGAASGVAKSGAYGFQARLSGQLAKEFDIMYRVKTVKGKWQSWVYNGITAASAGKLDQLSQIEVKVVSKLSSPKLGNEPLYLVPASASGKAVAVEKSSVKSGAALVIQAKKKIGAESFTFVPAGKDVYLIVNAASGMAIGVKSGSKANGAAVVQMPKKKSAMTKWKASLDEDGSVILTNQASGKALTVKNGGKAGLRLVSSADTGNTSQRWKLVESDYGLSGDYELDAGIAKILQSHKTLRSCFNYVVSFKYRSGNKYGKTTLGDAVTRGMAKEMIRNHGGNCYRFASLFSWLARGLGYQTNVKAGYVPSARGGWAPHGWVELYIGGKTYICDPDLAHELPGHNWYMTTYGGAPVSYSR